MAEIIKFPSPQERGERETKKREEILNAEEVREATQEGEEDRGFSERVEIAKEEMRRKLAIEHPDWADADREAEVKKRFTE